MMLLCLAVAAEIKLDIQATEMHAVRAGEDSAENSAHPNIWKFRKEP